MGKIREVALRYFDAFDITAEPKDGTTVDVEKQEIVTYEGCQVTHPAFRGSLFPFAGSDEGIALRNIMDDPTEFEKTKSKLTSNARTQLNSVETPAEIVATLTKLYRIPFLKETKQFLSLADYNQVLRLIIIDSGIASSPSERAQFKADVLELFDESFVPQFFMAGIEQEQYNALPDVVTVYHGVNEDTEDCEISEILYWTTKIAQLIPIGNFSRHASDTGIVYEAKIKKQDIYAYLVMDETVLLNPDKLLDIVRSGESSSILQHEDFPLDDPDEDFLLDDLELDEE